MELDGLLQHFFGSKDPSTLTEAAFARALEQVKIGFGVEREPGRRFALWCLLDALGEAPFPANAFAKEPLLKAAAEDYLKAAYRLERDGPGDA
ncbi:hypothetical protein [Novosphingobium sp.]|uniref:hypothetical protein n=1 Tax=Novosphingobium sp. TaxID=1874826 RepID=UPI00286CD278|nr:hypothetical protein [Novosphingobium sp.]